MGDFGHDDHTDEQGHGHSRTAGLLGALNPFHAHHGDAPVDRQLQASRDGLRALGVSLAALGATALAQLGIVFITGSVALLSDTIHNFTDALTAIPLGFAFWLGRRPASRAHTFGFGKAEDLAGLFIVALIAVSAGVAAYQSIDRLGDPGRVSNGGLVLAAGIVGFAGNEAVALYRIRVGKRIGSAALVADGLHARTDGITSLGVAASAVAILAGLEIADPIAGLVITAIVLVVLARASWEIYGRLMDRVDPELVEQVREGLLAVDGIEDVQAVRMRWIGHELYAEAELVSDADLTVAEAHAIAEEAEHALLHALPRLTRVLIHTNPCGHSGDPSHDLIAHHLTPSRPPSGSR